MAWIVLALQALQAMPWGKLRMCYLVGFFDALAVTPGRGSVVFFALVIFVGGTIVVFIVVVGRTRRRCALLEPVGTRRWRWWGPVGAVSAVAPSAGIPAGVAHSPVVLPCWCLCWDQGFW